MPANRLSISQIRTILRLRFYHSVSIRDIAYYAGASRSSVLRAVHRADRAHLTWPLPAGMTNEELEAVIYPPANHKPQPDWAEVHRVLSSTPAATLQDAWREYIAQHPNGYKYSQWCDLFRAWRSNR